VQEFKNKIVYARDYNTSRASVNQKLYKRFCYVYCHIILFFNCLSFWSSSRRYRNGKIRTKQRTRYNFELYNKSSDIIWFSIYFPGWVRNNKIIAYQKIDSGDKFRSIIKLEENPVIQIWRKEEPTYLGRTRERAPTIERQLKPCIGQHAEIIGIFCNRTAFLTFDENNVLRPQTGPYEGLSPLTESGLYRGRNIKQIGIRPVAKSPR